MRELDVEQLQKLWNDFAILRRAMLADLGEQDYPQHEDFQQKAVQWANDFKRITFEEVSSIPRK